MSNQYSESDVLFQVKYDDDNRWLDGLKQDAIYDVIEELEHQYVIIDDDMNVCKISKRKVSRIN